ncbi:phage head completion protein, partial [Xenorhabdus bovienii]
MKAGSLHHRIKLFRPVVTRDNYGTETVTSEYVSETWARAEAMSNR